MVIYQEIWQSLESSNSMGYIRRRVKPQSVCGLFLAVTKPENLHMLHIGLANASTIKTVHLPSARGLDIIVVHPENGQNGWTIQLTLRESRFDTVFDALIHDVIEVVARARSESAAVSAFISRLLHWQKFLEQVSPDGLSKEAQQGLYGELWFLRERLISLVGLYPALLAWVGPRGAHQDFMLQSCAIEVKTTGSKEPQQLIIQSERQLDDTGLSALFLLHLSLDVRESAGESLIMMVNSLRELLKADTAALELYEDRLIDAGFLQFQSLMYEKTKYTIRRSSFFHVKDAFPRIVGADLRPGVGAVRYSIAAAECHHFSITEDKLKSQLIGLNHGK